MMLISKGFSRSAAKTIPLLVMGVIVVAYFVVVIKSTYNIPIFDDYFGALAYLDAFFQSPFMTKLHAIFVQANEHRNVSYYLIVVLQYLFFGEIDFFYFTLVGNLSMVWLLFLIYRANPRFRTELVLFIPVVLILFVPLFKVAHWSMVTIHGMFQYCLALSALSLLSKPGKYRFVAAVLLASLATFSFGNGVLVFVSGYLLLLFSGNISKKRVMFWTISMIVTVGLFLIDYQFVVGGISKEEIFHHPLKALYFFLTMIGSTFRPVIGFSDSMLFIPGIVLAASLLYIVWHRRKSIKQDVLTLSYLTFFLLSMLLITVSKFSTGLESAIAPRFALITASFLALLYSMMVSRIRNPGIPLISFLMAASMLLYSFRIDYQQKMINDFNYRQINSMIQYHLDPDTQELPAPNPNVGGRILTTAIAKGMYTPPTMDQLVRHSKTTPLDLPIAITPEVTLVHLDQVNDRPDYVQIEGWAFSKTGDFRNQQTALVLISETDTLAFTTSRTIRSDVVHHFSGQYSGIRLDCGFQIQLFKPLISLPPGTYKIGAGLYDRKNIVNTQLTNATISIH